MDTKISQLSALTLPAPGDLFVIVDISDTGMAATGTDKKVTFANVEAALTIANLTGNLPVTKLDSGNNADNTRFWRGDGAWAVPVVSATPGGSTTQVQYNNAGVLGGITGATTDGSILSLASPIIASPTITSEWSFGAHTAGFTETDNGNSGTAKTVDWRLSNHQKITTTGSCTLTFTAPTKPCVLSLKIVHNASATAYTYTWPASVKWPSGTAVTTTNTSGAVDIVSLRYDGTNYHATGLTNFS